jgi:Protein of unknown function (DUF669)
MSDVLDLSGADTSGFEALPAGAYNCTVYETELTEVGPNAKSPPGTPMVKVQFRVKDGEEHEGHPFWANYPLPGKDVENAAKTLGNFVNFLVAAGEDADKVKSKGFDTNKLDSLEGREVVVRVTRGEWPKDSGEYTNNVRGVKPAGSSTGKRPSVL